MKIDYYNFVRSLEERLEENQEWLRQIVLYCNTKLTNIGNSRTLISALEIAIKNNKKIEQLVNLYRRSPK